MLLGLVAGAAIVVVRVAVAAGFQVLNFRITLSFNSERVAGGGRHLTEGKDVLGGGRGVTSEVHVDKGSLAGVDRLDEREASRRVTDDRLRRRRDADLPDWLRLSGAGSSGGQETRKK